MAKKKVTTTVVTEEIVDDGKKRPFHAYVLIDNSGSMTGWEDKVVTGVNEYVDTLKKTAMAEGISANVTVALFSSHATTSFSGIGTGSITASSVNLGPSYAETLQLKNLRVGVDVRECAPLTRAEVVPNGMTPLYDAVARSARIIEDTWPERNVAFVILTDGGENTSRENTAASVRALISQKQAKGWAVIYLGANQDAWAVGGQMGVAPGSTFTYDMSVMGAAFRSSATASARYMSTGLAQNATFTAEEQASMTAEKK